MHAHTQTNKHTHILIRSLVIFYLALQKRSVNWFIIFAVVHFKLQLQERTSDEKLIGLSDTVIARRSKRWFISFCTNDWGGIIFPLLSILTHPTVKGWCQCHRQQTDSIFTGFIYTYCNSIWSCSLTTACHCDFEWYDLAVSFWTSIYWIIVLLCFLNLLFSSMHEYST